MRSIHHFTGSLNKIATLLLVVNIALTNLWELTSALGTARPVRLGLALIALFGQSVLTHLNFIICNTCLYTSNTYFLFTKNSANVWCEFLHRIS